MSSYSSYYNLGFLTAFLGIFIIIAAIALIVNIFYLLTLQNTLHAIAPQNRTMRPGQVWLLLIPIFGTVWSFIMVGNMADSIENEFRARNWPTTARPTYSLGLAMSILAICSFIPFVRGFAGIAYLICWIVYWVQINDIKQRLSVPYTPHENNFQP
jgi:hypothetical protein